jgi:hypothetical protein
MKSSLAHAAPLLLLLVAQVAFSQPSDRTRGQWSALDARAYSVLLEVFNVREDWTSIHAAEILVQLGKGDSIRDAMLRRMERSRASRPIRSRIHICCALP